MMNERIQELYQKAHDVYQWDYPSSPVDPTVRSVHTSRQFNPEKFAELLVKECIHTLQLKIVRNGNTPENQRSREHIRDLAEHFGVQL